MKRLCLFVLLLFCCIPGFTQNAKNEKDPAIRQGIQLYENGEYEKSIKILEDRLKVAIDQKDRSTQQVIYNNLANDYADMGKTEKGLELYEHAETLAEELKDRKGQAKAIKNIGALYSDIKDFEKALKKFEEAEAIAVTVNDSSTLADCANNKGLVFEQQKKYDAALNEYSKALAIYISLKRDERIAILYNNLGVVYKYLGKYDSSIKYYDLSLAISEKMGSKFMIAANLINVGNVYEMKGDYKKAIDMNLKGLATGKELGSKELVIEAYENLAQDYAKSGDYKTGFETYKIYTTEKDSLVSIEWSKQLAEMQTKYETAKKEKVILQLQQSKIIMLSVIGSMILLIIIAFLLYNRQQIKQRQQREKAIAEAEYHERMRIAKDVHDDLGSGLSKISLMATKAQKNAQGNDELGVDIKHISNMSHELVDNMRDLIWVLNPENTTLEQLVARLREYCGDYLDGLPLEASLDFPLDTPDLKIAREAQRNVFLTVKESINNSVKHSGADSISITLKIDANNLVVVVSDNGRGFDKDKIRTGANGLRNMKQRIENIGGSYSIVPEHGKGTTTTISVPLMKMAAAKNTTFV